MASTGTTGNSNAPSSSAEQGVTLVKNKDGDSRRTSGAPAVAAGTNTPVQQKDTSAPKDTKKVLSVEEKKAQALAQKKAFDDRFKKRGKRPLPPREDGDVDPSKKPKRELSAYEKEVQKYESRMLKDQGSGVRSVMK